MLTVSANNCLRKLAKSDYWQSIYSLSKEHTIKLFFNDNDFSEIQFDFLKYLNFYSSLFTDIALGEVNELVLENTIYEDSYMLYKNKADKKKLPRGNYQENNVLANNTVQWIFKKPKEKK